MNRARGQLLLIGLLLIILSINISRIVFQVEDDPAFLSKKPTMVEVELGSGFSEQSVRQFIDGSRWLDVIKLTIDPLSPELQENESLHTVIITGQKIDLITQGLQIKGFQISWMTAAKRIALGIPLHPDRMTEADWQELPGIGAKMARRIERNRQENGEFGPFSSLLRVSGIGKKRLTTWNQYFFTESLQGK